MDRGLTTARSRRPACCEMLHRTSDLDGQVNDICCPVTYRLSPWLLGRCSRQLRKSCAGPNMVYSRTERVFVLEHYFASKSFAVVHEAFSNT
jgi:hypothetical protein